MTWSLDHQEWADGFCSSVRSNLSFFCGLRNFYHCFLSFFLQTSLYFFNLTCFENLCIFSFIDPSIRLKYQIGYFFLNTYRTENKYSQYLSTFPVLMIPRLHQASEILSLAHSSSARSSRNFLKTKYSHEMPK